MPELTVRELMRMPWTYLGPTEVRDDAGSHFELTIAELPDFFLAGTSRAEVLAELREAMHAFLCSYVDRHEQPPLPSQPGRWQARMIRPGVKAPPVRQASVRLVSRPPASTGNLRLG